MKYIEIYEARDKRKFREIEDLFKSNNIDYKTLFEYKLDEERNFGETEGGTLINVLQRDYLRANHLLIAKGYKKQFESYEFKFVKKVDSLLSGIPVLNKFSKSTRLVIAIFLLLVTPFLIGIITLTDWKTKSLLDEYWCVDKIVSNDKELKPSTNRPIIIISLGCLEDVRFRSDGTVSLPGFNTNGSNGLWEKLPNNMLKIYDVDEHEEVYNGVYKIKTKQFGDKLELKSDETRILLSNRW